MMSMQGVGGLSHRAPTDAETELQKKSAQILAVARQIEKSSAELRHLRGQEPGFVPRPVLPAPPQFERAKQLAAEIRPDLEEVQEKMGNALRVAIKLNEWFVENSAKMNIQDVTSTPSAFLQQSLESCDRRVHALHDNISKTVEGGFEIPLLQPAHGSPQNSTQAMPPVPGLDAPKGLTVGQLYVPSSNSFPAQHMQSASSQTMGVRIGVSATDPVSQAPNTSGQHSAKPACFSATAPVSVTVDVATKSSQPSCGGTQLQPGSALSSQQSMQNVAPLATVPENSTCEQPQGIGSGGVQVHGHAQPSATPGVPHRAQPSPQPIPVQASHLVVDPLAHSVPGTNPGPTPFASQPGGAGVVGMWVRDPDAG